MENWSLHDAKGRFSALVERLEALRAQQLPSFAEHLLAMPQDDEAFERIDVDLRDPALWL